MSNKDAYRVLTVKDNSRYIIEVEVGKMPPHRVKTYLKDIAALMKSIENGSGTFIPKDAKVLIVPCVDGVPTVRITELDSGE